MEANKEACEDLKTRKKEIVNERQKSSNEKQMVRSMSARPVCQHYQNDCSISVASARRPKELLHDVSR